jgi:hypothetical protein
MEKGEGHRHHQTTALQAVSLQVPRTALRQRREVVDVEITVTDVIDVEKDPLPATPSW